MTKPGEAGETLVEYLAEKAKELRIRSVQLISRGGFGHPGGSLSEADIVAALYFHVLRLDPARPRWDGRDRFVLSKGHGCPPVYVALCMRGFFPPEELESYGHVGSKLQGHPDSTKTPGIEISTGSLGQGLSVAVGMALAAKRDEKEHAVYCLLGDGETDCGQVWEAAMAAAHYGLDNLVAIVDYNGLQAKGFCHEIMRLEPYAPKWDAFGWKVIEIDGHDMRQILDALHRARYVKTPGRPTVIIAHTVKGKGVSWMENTHAWHTHAPNEEQCARAVAELRGEQD